MLPGEATTFTSIDRCSEKEDGLGTDLPTNVFNKQLPSGMPPHKLRLKPGCVVICLRNLNVTAGVCNGTRLRVDTIKEEVSGCRSEDPQTLCCTLLTTPQAGTQYLFTKIELEPADKDVDPSHAFIRTQFPLRLAYCLTVNKAQGQTLSKVLSSSLFHFVFRWELY